MVINRNIILTVSLAVLFISQIFCAKSKIQMTTDESPIKWTGFCIDASAMQSPININGPFSFMSMDLDIVFRQIDSGQSYLQNVNNELVIKGDFGYISQDSTIFSSYEIAFKSPSEHSVGNSQTFFPLEMQVKFVSASQSKLNMAFLFSYGEESDFLNRLGFGRGVLRNLLQNQNFEIPQAFNLQHVLPSKNKFFIYKGSDTMPPCEPTIWLIGYDTLKLNQAQLNDFPISLSYQGRDTQKKKQEIFINFNIEKEEEKKDEQEQQEDQLDELNSTDQNLHNQYNQQQVNLLNKIKDSFILLGDSTIYDPFVYGHDSEPSAKFIKDTDYIVIQKEKPNLNKMKEQVEIEEIIFDKLRDDQKARQDKIDEDKSKEEYVPPSNNYQSQPDKDEKIEKKEDQSQQQSTNSAILVHKKTVKGRQDKKEAVKVDSDSQTSQKKEEVVEKLKKKNEGPEHYAYNQDGEWDKIPIFSIDSWPQLCQEGKQQSPINIDPQSLMVLEDGEVNVYYNQLNQDPWLFNDNIKLTLGGLFGTIEFQEHLYDANFIHFHFPSEHTFGADNKRADIEFQIEHVSLYGQKLVVSILGDLSDTQTNPFLEAMGISGHEFSKFQKIDEKIQLKPRLVSLDILADSLESFYRYEGSFTHPPCTEGVTWIISRDHVQLNKIQLDNLRSLLGLKQNVRGTHDLNGREIFVK
ncbi:hypothetical protein ABPG74_003338 [Tetrahymena malaccensis]